MIRRDFIRLIIPAPMALASGCRSEEKAEAGAKPEPEYPEVTFGVIADPQYADRDARGSRFYRKSLDKLQTAVIEMEKHEMDFVVTLGDVIDKDFKSFAEIMPRYTGFNAPRHFVLGNHDFDVADEDKAKVIATIGLEDPYYSRLVNGWRFIYLDGTEVSTYRYPKGHSLHKPMELELARLQAEKLPQAHSWNGGISEAQLAWFRAELEAAKLAGERVIVANHFPVMPAGDAHNLWNAEEVVKLIDQYDHVPLYMNGHNHVGNYAERKGTHYVNFKGMVETKERTAYAMVRCFADRVEIEGYGTEMDRVMK